MAAADSGGSASEAADIAAVAEAVTAAVEASSRLDEGMRWAMNREMREGWRGRGGVRGAVLVLLQCSGDRQRERSPDCPREHHSSDAVNPLCTRRLIAPLSSPTPTYLCTPRPAPALLSPPLPAALHSAPAMTSHLPAYDLHRLRVAYSDPVKERAALLALARAAQSAERWEDLLRFSREIVRAAQMATPGADLTQEERMILFTATKQVRKQASEGEATATLQRPVQQQSGLLTVALVARCSSLCSDPVRRPCCVAQLQARRQCS